MYVQSTCPSYVKSIAYINVPDVAKLDMKTPSYLIVYFYALAN